MAFCTPDFGIPRDPDAAAAAGALPGRSVARRVGLFFLGGVADRDGRGCAGRGWIFGAAGLTGRGGAVRGLIFGAAGFGGAGASGT
ncbi:MAG: hypothetical protein CMJ90_14750 [Planctomycetes bacterium]|nr:hypothetical protein [Planctomycetota bacterium]